MWLMQNAFAKPDNAGAGATDFMHLFGLVALGYMWGRIAKAAVADQPRRPPRAGTPSSRAAGSSWSGCCRRPACGSRGSRPARRAPWRWRRRRSEPPAGRCDCTPAAGTVRRRKLTAESPRSQASAVTAARHCPGGEPSQPPSAASRSSMRSAGSSRPIDSRTTSGPAPAAVFCASVSWRWVVEAGWMISERVSPILARCENSCRLRHQLHAGLVAALQPEGEDRAGARSACNAGRAGDSGRSPGPG